MSESNRNVPEPDAPIINDQADRMLGRIIIRYGLLSLALLTLVSLVMIPVNAPFGELYRAQHVRAVFRILMLDFLSTLVVLLPFFLGINRLFATRLRLGRDLTAQRRWREAVAALDPFAGPTQRFLDRTGEAHALLAQAYVGVGDTQKAEATRAFVLRHRPGVWADQARTARPAVPASGQEKRPRPSNGKRRRRF